MTNNIHHLRLIIVAVCLLFGLQIAWSIDYKFQHISVDEGLKNNRIVSLAQDMEGYMWFATHNGVDKFNGADLKHYTLSIDGELGVPNDQIINCLEFSEYNDILCGTKSGNVYRYNREQDHFERLFHNSDNDALFNVTAIHSINKGEMWVGTTSSLFYFNLNAPGIQSVNKNTSTVNCITKFNDNYELVGSASGLHFLNNEDKKLIAIDNALFSKKDITSIQQIDKHFYIGTRDGWVYKTMIDINNIEVVASVSFSKKEKVFPIKDIVLTPDKHVLFGIDGLGMVQTDGELNNQQWFKANENDDYSLSSNGIYNLCFSEDNILWVGAYGSGVCYSDPNIKKFHIERHVAYKGQSLRSNVTNAIFENIDGCLWYGGKNGISIYDPKTEIWKHVPRKQSPDELRIQVMSICAGQNGNVWVATYGQGIHCFSSKGQRLRSFTENASNKKHQIETDHLYQNYTDSKGKIWTGGIWGGISVIDFNGLRTTVNISNVRSFYEYKNHMYVGTLFGLFVVDLDTYKVSRPSLESLISNRIICMTSHPTSNKLLLGTDANGLIEWNHDNDSLNFLQSEHGLPSNFIRSMVWVNDTTLWLASTGGLSKIQNFSVYDNYDLSDGLANTVLLENSICKKRDGQLLFGGPRGVSYFYPSQIHRSTQKNTPILNEIKLFGKTLPISPDGILQKNINLQETFKLKYNENTFGISFGAIAYTNPHKVMFKWKLEGFEEQWNGPNQIREANYTKVPSGNYTFKLMVSNDDDVWQEAIKKVSISIDKPFYTTFWAYLVYFMIVLSLTLVILHYNKLRLHERHNNEKQQFFISIAHDLRTPLSLIKLPVEKMVEESEEEDSNLSLIKRNIDRLSNLVNQLLDFQKADLKKMQLQVSEYDINTFIQERVKAFEPLSKEKNISVTISLPNESSSVWFDRNKMEKVMYNLLSNAFKYTPKNGEIKVCILIDKKYCTITVDDTGEGIPAKQQKKIFQHYYRATNAINSKEVGSGVGLMLTKEIVELHKGDISFESTLGEGSVFRVKLLLGNHHYTHEDFSHSEDESQLPTPIVDQSNTESYANVSSIGIKLLIVEDNPELLEALKQDFSKDYNVFGAANGKEGMEKVNEYMPDIIISDVMMPEMNGHQLCQQLKNDLSTCHIPIILLTALDSPDYKREGLEHGADAYLEKPFDLKLLRAQVSNLLKSRQQLRQKFQEPESELKEVAPTNADEQFLEKIKSYVIENIDKDELSVESTAIELGMSRPVLYRKIKSLTDLSPQQLLMTIKLKEAARILKEEGKNISETAYMIGFTDPKYFSQTFKKYFGMTPSEYLKK
ncbi:hybrid sensor histidine kinase/response regulator transcription factor [Carboxylicivirga sp. N1Y90]|uniref:hybrid sensor histidine kinase/response regulator transcription factor n=1 Tax=Carboxylicivirga fragile TaxID=3417571 RepID=UPI003D356D7A|nr:response regulator [Marinilabiliaceae bacterium N1Y90]